MSLEPGKHLGPYEIVGLIGADGMDEVYRAQPSDKQQQAISTSC